MIINPKLFEPANLLVIVGISITGMWLAKRYMPHPGTCSPNEVMDSSPTSSISENDISVVDMGSPDFRISAV